MDDGVITKGESFNIWKFIFTITLSDGTKLSNLSMSGNNFVSEEPITEETFENNLSKVTFETDDGHIFNEENLELANLSQYDGKYYFFLKRIPKSELQIRRMESAMEYIAMMSDIEL